MAKNEVLGNLVWLDLEMTGLVIATDVILEIATVVTDGNCNVIAEGPRLVINQPEEKLAAMGKWCQDQHGKTGLIEEVRNSKVSLHDAEEAIFVFLKQNCAPGTGILAGNTVWQDRVFLDKYMPRVSSYLHYRLIDVSSIKELVKRWYPDNKNIEFKKSDRHRAMSDVYESIAELQHYRKNFFVSN